MNEPAGGIAAQLLGLPGEPSLSLAVAGDDPINDFKVNVRLDTDGQERLVGGVTLVTDEAGTTRFDTALEGDVTPLLAEDMASLFGDELKLVARGTRAQDGGLQLDVLDAKARGLLIAGSAAIAADGWPNKLALDVEIAPKADEGSDAALSEMTGSFKVGFDAAKGDAWQVTGHVSGLEQGGLKIEDARFSGTGSILREAESLSGELRLDARGLDAEDPHIARAIGGWLRGNLRFGWKKTQPLRLYDIDLSGADYGMTGSVSVSGLEGSELTIAPDLLLNAKDLSRFAGAAGADLSGQASLVLRGGLEPLTGVGSVRAEGKTRDLGLGIGQLDPLLAGAGVLTLDVTRDQSGIHLEVLDIKTGKASIAAEASLETGGGFARASAKLWDTSDLVPELDGSAELSVDAQKTGETWTVQANAELPGNARAEYRGTVTGDGQMRLLTEGALTATIADLSPFSTLAGYELQGAADLRAKGQADVLEGLFELTVTGGAQELKVNDATLGPLLNGVVKADLDVKRDASGAILIRDARLDAPGVKADLSGRVGPDEGQLDFKVSTSNLGALIADVPGPANLSGTARRNADNWDINVSAEGSGGVGLSAVGTVAGDASHLNLDVNGSAPLAMLNRRLSGQAISGLVRFDLAVDGPPDIASVTGALSVDNGRFSAPGQNFRLERINAKIDLSGGEARLSLVGDVATGGRVRLDGPISLSAPYNAGINGRFEAVTLRESSLYEARLSGQVSLDGPLTGQARLAGVIDVSEAELRLPQFGPSYSALDGLKHLHPASGVRRTLRFSGQETAPQSSSSGPEYLLDLTVNAPKRLFVRGRGLDAELGGTLRLTGTTANVVPVGELELIRGRLDLLRRRLELTEGSLWMRGSFDPVIAFAATTRIEEVDVSLRLDGVASSPELTVTSIPEMPQEEALSFFLFGRSVTEISALQAVQLASAIRTLSGRGGAGLTDRLRETIGVDDLDIGTDSEGTAQARAGRYLSENIYTDVTVKSDGTSQINLNLEARPNLVVRGRMGSDGDTGIGAYFEKDY